MKNTVAIALLMLVPIFSQSCSKANEPSPPDDASFVGQFTIIKTSIAPWDTVNNEIAAAHFFNAPVSAAGINAGTVSLNGKLLELQGIPDTSYSLGSTNFHLSDSTVWQVSGGGGIAAFSYNYNTPFPTFSTPLPDTISKSGWNYNFSATDADSIVITFRYPEVVKHLGGSSSSVSFSTADLAGLQENSRVLLEISVFSTHYETINGNYCAFMKEDRKDNYLWVTP
ncbi:MAG: hypothetical protein JST21_18780 [Bacteroidetes bacterium]|nr:hypothetical protein [Bacteroidota bacterium]MBS1748210.1 hypothetical protein [Bacteroidota bacterium]